MEPNVGLSISSGTMQGSNDDRLFFHPHRGRPVCNSNTPVEKKNQHAKPTKPAQLIDYMGGIWIYVEWQGGGCPSRRGHKITRHECSKYMESYRRNLRGTGKEVYTLPFVFRKSLTIDIMLEIPVINAQVVKFSDWRFQSQLVELFSYICSMLSSNCDKNYFCTLEGILCRGKRARGTMWYVINHFCVSMVPEQCM